MVSFHPSSYYLHLLSKDQFLFGLSENSKRRNLCLTENIINLMWANWKWYSDKSIFISEGHSIKIKNKAEEQFDRYLMVIDLIINLFFFTILKRFLYLIFWLWCVCCCTWASLVKVSRGHSVVVRGLLTVLICCGAWALGVQASLVAVCGFSSCGPHA